MKCGAERGGGRCAGVRGSVKCGARGREGRCCVGSVSRCGEGVGKSGGGMGDVWGVWEGLGEVRRRVGEDVSMCEERCGSVEKCCEGVWESVGKPKKVFTVAGVHFSAQNQGKTKKWSYTFHELSPPFATFAPISLFAPWCLSFAPKEAISPTLRTAALQYRYSYTYGCCTEIYSSGIFTSVTHH